MKVFVYGTLRQGDCRSGVLQDYPCLASEAYIEGFDLLNLGAFPGIVPGEGRVRGELYEIDEVCLRVLDGIEGFRKDDPKHSLYLREQVVVEVPSDGEEELFFPDVYVYVYNIERGADRMRPVIESGDWFDAVEGRRGRTHSTG